MVPVASSLCLWLWCQFMSVDALCHKGWGRGSQRRFSSTSFWCNLRLPGNEVICHELASRDWPPTKPRAATAWLVDRVCVRQLLPDRFKVRSELEPNDVPNTPCHCSPLLLLAGCSSRRSLMLPLMCVCSHVTGRFRCALAAAGAAVVAHKGNFCVRDFGVVATHSRANAVS